MHEAESAVTARSGTHLESQLTSVPMDSSTASQQPTTKPAPMLGKSGKKICCSCPDTRKLRDACMVANGQEACKAEIEAHNKCLREEGFKV